MMLMMIFNHRNSQTSTRTDIPSIICLLQAAGFKLREFDKDSQLIPNKQSVKSENIRITLECGTSKMVAVLEMGDVKCQCPDSNDAKDGSIWSITGTGPLASEVCPAHLSSDELPAKLCPLFFNTLIISNSLIENLHLFRS